MDRKQAIEAIKELLEDLGGFISVKQRKALYEAIKTFKKEMEDNNERKIGTQM